MKQTRNILVPLLIVTCVFATSCKHEEPIAEERLERLHTKWDETPLRVEQQPVAIKQGTTPLAHIFIAAGPVRVVDLTSNVTVAAVTVDAQTLVRIDDRHGVIAGDKTITPGPLPPGHQYAIYADPVTDNTMRHGVGPPAQTARPPAQQQSQQP